VSPDLIPFAALADAATTTATTTPAWVPLVIVVSIALAVGAVALAVRSRRPAGAQAGGRPPLAIAHLEFIYGPLDGRVFELGDQVATLGSAQGNTVVLPDPSVSRKHLGIRRDPSGAGYELADLGSTNGVYVNGHRLARKLLQAGDIIRIGSSEMVFQSEKRG
jgi:hypothetical protein